MVRVAILMSTYNGKEYLNKQLKSLAEQTINAIIRVYIRDDGSSDNTYRIINKWKGRLNITLFTGTNLGPAHSFWMLMCNKDIQADFYAFCDQDDIWDNNKLEQQILRLNEDTNLCICNSRIINSDDKIISALYQETTPSFTYPHIFAMGLAQGCAMVFNDKLRKYIMEKNISSIPMHDMIVLLYALDCGNVVWISTPLFGYRVHMNNVVFNGNKTFKCRLNNLWKKIKNKDGVSNSMVARELLYNCNNLRDKEYLRLMSSYHGSFIKKTKLIFYPGLKRVDKKGLKSYRIKLLLGLL